MKFLNKAALSVIKLLHRLYKLTLSPFIGPVCRFHPPCSDYAISAVEKHGFLWGAWLALKRVIRCNPWHAGGFDPVPEPPNNNSSGFRNGE